MVSHQKPVDEARPTAASSTGPPAWRRPGLAQPPSSEVPISTAARPARRGILSFPGAARRRPVRKSAGARWPRRSRPARRTPSKLLRRGAGRGRRGSEQVTHVGRGGAVQAGIPGQRGHHLQAGQRAGDDEEREQAQQQGGGEQHALVDDIHRPHRRRRSSAQDPAYFFLPHRPPAGRSRRPAGPPSRLPAWFAAAGTVRGRADAGATGLSPSLRRWAVRRVIRCWHACWAAAVWPFALENLRRGTSRPGKCRARG